MRKSLKIKSEEFASICRWQTPEGKLVIDVMMDTLTPQDARRLGHWLIEAADYVVTENRKRKQTKDQVILGGEE